MKQKCYYCGKKLWGLVVGSATGKRFCLTEHAPLEENSCAFNYVLEHQEELGKNYFFAEIEDRDKS